MSLNLATLLRVPAARRPAGTSLLFEDRAISYQRLDDEARLFAGRLAGLGVSRGRHVALLLPNAASFTTAYFGCHYLGCPVVPLNVLLTAEEIAFHLEDSEAAALVAWPACAAAAKAALARVSLPARLILADGSELECDRPVTEPADTMPDDTAVILYTSGTTGRPKGAELTHFNLFANADHVGRLFSFDESTRGLAALPLFHSFGQTVVQNAILMKGGAVVMMPRFEGAAALDLIARHGVTFFAGVPTMYFAMLHDPGAAGVPGPPAALRTCMSGGAPMPVEVLAEFEARFGVTILESYGLSETSPVASLNHPGRPRKPGSIGEPLEGVEFRLVDDEGRVVEGAGAPGEILIKGYNVMKGYYKRPEATAESLHGGWLRTGDVAVRDEDGYYVIVDRRKDMILRGGYNVYPREIEEVLYAHPAVAEVAVVGVADEKLGEEVKAVVSLRPGRPATADELIDYCRERLAAYKYPRLVEFRASLPKGPTGKILKRALRG